jgi:hypothetical protein
VFVERERICSRCRVAKPLTEFGSQDRRGRYDTYCRACRREYGREHYLKHRQRYIDQAIARKRIRRRERAEFLLEFYATHPCVDCGETDPVVLEFDHPGEKQFNIGYGFEAYGWQRVLDEIENCDVVCANCHRRRTYRRAGSWRAVLTGLVDDQRSGRRDSNPY